MHRTQLLYSQATVFLKSEGSVQIYMTVLNIGCESQNSGGNVVSFSKINSYETSFLVKTLYEQYQVFICVVKLLCSYICNFQKDFLRKRNSNVHFKFLNRTL